MSDKDNVIMINLSKTALTEEHLEELSEKISDILNGKDVKGMELPPIADSSSFGCAPVVHNHEWT